MMLPARISEARSPLSDHPLPIVLYPSRVHKVISLVYLALSTAFLVNVIQPIPTTLVGLLFTGAIALWLLRVIVVNCMYLYPGSTFLKLDSASFTISSNFRQHQIPWSVVRRFAPVDASSSSSRIWVGWQMLPGYAPDDEPRSRFGRPSDEFDGILSSNYGLSPQDLADLLNQLRDRFTTDPSQASDRANPPKTTTAVYSAKALAILHQSLPIKLSGGLARVLISQSIVIGVIGLIHFGFAGTWPLILILSFVVLTYLYPKTNGLYLHRDGFTVHSFLSEETVRWEAIAEFVPEFTRNSSYVGWRYHPTHSPQTKIVKMQRVLLNVDEKFSDNYGLRATDLADILNEMLARYRTSSLDPSSATSLPE